MTLSGLAAVGATVVLLYVVGARLLGGARFGAAAAALCATTPLLWAGAVPLAPLPFAAGWLAAVAYLDHKRAAAAALAAGACLAAGVYCSTAAMVMMPVYLLITVAVLARRRRDSWRQLALIAAAFTVGAAPLAWRFLMHPEQFRDLVNTYHLYDANRFNLRQGIREMASWVGLTARTEVYYDYFNPAFLFLSGRVLLAPLLVLVPIGLYHILSDETAPASRLTLAAFLVAPFAASLTAQPPIPERMAFVTPFAAVVATFGVKRLAAWYRASYGAGSRMLAGS